MSFVQIHIVIPSFVMDDSIASFTEFTQGIDGGIIFQNFFILAKTWQKHPFRNCSQGAKMFFVSVCI